MLEGNSQPVRTWIEIDTQAIHNNYTEFRRIVGPRVKVAAVIKSNAYGHNFISFAFEMQEIGIDWLIVDSFVEAKTLRTKGTKLPILVLGYTLPENYSEAAQEGISLTVSNITILETLDALTFEKPLRIHIKVDTGMHRQGFMEKEMDEVLKQIKKLGSHIELEGLYTHFSSAKNPKNADYTHFQIENFMKWKNLLFEAGFSPLAHAAATSGTILFPQYHFDMVRIGIGMYGLWPSKETEKYAKDSVQLLPALTWKTIVGEIKMLPKGSAVGYDGTEVVDKDTIIAVLPVGYWHGYPRILSSIGKVLIHECEARVIGRVSMDMIVVDVSKIKDVNIGDEVVLLGRQGKGEVSATQFADLAQTVNYEVVTRLNPKIKRVYK